MKICVNGSLIDLRKVYMITDISDRYFHSSRVIIKGEYTDEVDYYIEFSFTICFINKHSHTISIKRKIRIKSDDMKEIPNTPEYKKFMDEINLFRDSIIEKWDEGSFEYPQFNINLYED